MKKKAVVTGATSGIGRATAIALAAAGYEMVITGRRADRLADVKNEITSRYDVGVQILEFDIRDRKVTESAVDSIEGNIDLLVNNAGLAAGLEHIDEGNPDDWERMIDTNVKGLLFISRVVGRRMVSQGYGHIINIGSIAGVQTYENGAVYCATKHAVHALSQGMRADFLKSGIKVSEVRPGMVETEFSIVRFHGDKDRADNVYKGVDPLTAKDIADIVVWVASQPKHVNINDVEVTPLAQASSYYVNRR